MQLMYQWYMSRQVSREERRTGRERRALRQRERPLGIDLDPLRVAAGCARERDDATAVELAGDLVAEHVGQLGHLRIETPSDQDVREVDAARAHFDNGRARRLRDVLERKVAADLAQH